MTSLLVTGCPPHRYVIANGLLLVWGLISGNLCFYRSTACVFGQMKHRCNCGLPIINEAVSNRVCCGSSDLPLER